MTIIPAGQLTSHELRMLGNNLSAPPEFRPPLDAPEAEAVGNEPAERQEPSPAEPEPIELPPPAWQRD